MDLQCTGYWLSEYYLFPVLRIVLDPHSKVFLIRILFFGIRIRIQVLKKAFSNVKNFKRALDHWKKNIWNGSFWHQTKTLFLPKIQSAIFLHFSNCKKKLKMFLKYRSWWRLDPDLDLDPYLHFMLDPDLFPPVQCTCCSVIESEICSLGELLQLLLRSFMWSSSSNSSSSHSPRLDNAALLQLFLETYFTELLSSPNRSQQVSTV